MLRILKKIKVSTIPLNTVDVKKARGCFLNDHLCRSLEFYGKDYVKDFYYLHLTYNDKKFNINRFRSCPWCKNDLEGLTQSEKEQHLSEEHLKTYWDYFEYRNQLEIVGKFNYICRKPKYSSIFLTYSGCLICDIPYAYIPDKEKRTCKEKSIRLKFRSFDLFGIDINNLLTPELGKVYIQSENDLRRFGGILVK